VFTRSVTKERMNGRTNGQTEHIIPPDGQNCWSHKLFKRTF